MKAEYKGLYEKFGLNVVYYRKRKKDRCLGVLPVFRYALFSEIK